MKQRSNNIGQVHSFSRTLAREHGKTAAILLAHFAYQIPIYQAARKDGLGYYASVRSLSQHYPYLTENQIEYALLMLREKKVLLTGNHNRMPGDKTLWYTFADPAVQKMALNDQIRFNVEIARHFGVDAALILLNIKYWIHKQQEKDGTFAWLRVSAKELAKHLPIPARTISRELLRLSEGVDRVLDRKPGSGFDQAYLYSIRNDQKCDGQESEIRGPKSGVGDEQEPGIHEPDSDSHRPACLSDKPERITHGPKHRTNTSYIETVVKNSVVKNECEKHIQTGPGMCVCLSHTLACGADDTGTSASSAPTIQASGQDSGRNETLRKEPGVASLNLIPSSQSLKPESDGASASLADQENDPALLPSAKARIFMSGVRNLNGLGSGLVYDGKTIEKAQHFFELNLDKPARSLLAVLEYCNSHRSLLNPIGDGEYDGHFHLRRSNNLNFFFKYLNILSGADLDGNLADAVFDEDGPGLNLKVAKNHV